MAHAAAQYGDGTGIVAALHYWRMQDFRQLLVWQRAHALTLAIKQVVRTFPRSGYSDLKSQILRATDSIVSNIVEGCGAATRKEFARYLDISIKSASEVDYRLQLARDDRCLTSQAWRPLSDQVVELRKMVCALRRTVLAADRNEERRRVVRKRLTDDR
jgi:four helix bundle protein